LTTALLACGGARHARDVDVHTDPRVTPHDPSRFYAQEENCACRPAQGSGLFHHLPQSCPMRQGSLRDAASLRVLARPDGHPLTHLADVLSRVTQMQRFVRSGAPMCFWATTRPSSGEGGRHRTDDVRLVLAEDPWRRGAPRNYSSYCASSRGFVNSLSALAMA
jgi:hypothetical protein